MSDCFCPDDCQIDGDGDGVSDCVDSDGLICTPESSDGVTADNCVTANVPASIDGSDYGGVVVECYCPTENCFLDANDDDEVDCLTPEGDICEALDFDLDGYADTCGNQVGIEIVPHQFDKFFEGAVSDCFCPDDCQIDGDGDGVSDCVDSDGLTCTPESSDGVTADNCVTADVPLL